MRVCWLVVGVFAVAGCGTLLTPASNVPPPGPPRLRLARRRHHPLPAAGRVGVRRPARTAAPPDVLTLFAECLEQRRPDRRGHAPRGVRPRAPGPADVPGAPRGTAPDPRPPGRREGALRAVRGRGAGRDRPAEGPPRPLPHAADGDRPAGRRPVRGGVPPRGRATAPGEQRERERGRRDAGRDPVPGARRRWPRRRSCARPTRGCTCTWRRRTTGPATAAARTWPAPPPAV